MTPRYVCHYYMDELIILYGCFYNWEIINGYNFRILDIIHNSICPDKQSS